MSTVRPIISLCIPTNGIIEWLVPVIESIYNQGVDYTLFEVIVSDNGDNEKVQDIMLDYVNRYPNFIYKKNKSFMFYNQLEALKLASGCYLKLVNHRAVFEQDALKRMIEIIKDNMNDKNIMYFSNGVLKQEKYSLSSFDQFVKTLGIYVSWTTGVGIWKEHFDSLPQDLHIDRISPHSCILFSKRHHNKYLIYNYEFSKQVNVDQTKKGNYDLFKAFCLEEITIAQNLYIDGDITSCTLKSVINDYKKFVSRLYLDYIIKKEKCSYDLSGFNANTGIYFSKYQIIFGAVIFGIKGLVKKLLFWVK